MSISQFVLVIVKNMLHHDLSSVPLDPLCKYEVCLKSNETMQCARCTKNFYRRESNVFYDVTMSYGFENQISTFCDNCILFCTFFCQGTFFVTVL